MYKYLVMPTAKIVESNRQIKKPNYAKGLLHSLYVSDSEFRETINEKYGFTNEKCNWCNNRLNLRAEFIENTLNNNVITVINVKKRNIFYCGHEECKALIKNYNPNSAYSVMKMHNLKSLDDALKYIKTHNKSPFYRENHETSAAYTEFQRRNDDVEKFAASNTKANFSRSLDGYIQRYGEELGNEIFEKTQKKKGITLENFIEKYGVDGKALFEKHVETRTKRNGSYFGTILYTHKGERLESRNEFVFYTKLVDAGLADHYKTQCFYGGERGHHSDFYFEDLDLHVEIAGMMHHEKYKNKMAFKKEIYGDKCVIIETHEFDDKILEIKQKLIQNGYLIL